MFLLLLLPGYRTLGYRVSGSWVECSVDRWWLSVRCGGPGCGSWGTFKKISLGCKHSVLNHVTIFRRQVFMCLDSPENMLDISFHVRHEWRIYMIYASTGSTKSFECGDIGHKQLTCPHRGQKEVAANGTIEENRATRQATNQEETPE